MPAQTFTITANVPTAPSGLEAAATAEAVYLRWADNAVNESNYKVLRRSGTAPFAVLSGATALAANTTSYTDSVVQVGNSYDYQVIAYNANGDSGPSNTATVMVPTPPPASGGTPVPQPVYEWIDPNGAHFDLATPGDVAVMLGSRGLGMPPIVLNEMETPFADGARLTGVRVPPREVDLPILLEAPNALSLRNKLRALLRQFAPQVGDGTLRVTGPDGFPRDLTCRYAGGLDQVTDSPDAAGEGWWVVALTLRAFDPYFYDTVPVIRTFGVAAPVSFFPILPLHFSASSVVGDSTEENAGDVDTWPVWTIQGPATAVTLRNVDTGEQLVVNRTLSGTDQLVIDTRPGAKSVTLNGSTNALDSLSATSAMWPLPSGTTNLHLELTGSTSASYVRLSYTPRYLSA